MFGKIVTILLIVFSSNCFGDVKIEKDWLGLDKKDSWQFYTGTGLLVIDTLQSRYISKTKNLRESNVILGDSPSASKVYAYNIAVIGINYAINRFSPRWLKNSWNAGLISVEIYCVVGNHGNGLRVYKKF